MTFFAIGIDPKKAILVALTYDWQFKLSKLDRITTESGIYELQDDVEDGGTVTVKRIE